MRKILYSLLLFALVAGGVAGIRATLDNAKMRGRAESHARAFTRADLVEIGVYMNTLQIYNPGAFTLNSISNCNARTLYYLLRNGDSKLGSGWMPPQWGMAGQLLDSWGRPIRVQVTIVTNTVPTNETRLTARFRLWSLGPNGRDEDGQGDAALHSDVAIPLQDK